MSQAVAEKQIFITLVICSILGITACVTLGIAWEHWRYTLDQCVDNKNCSCILYGQYTPSKFLGGNAAPCIWVAFGPILYILYTMSMACFHGYRVLFSSQSTRTRTIMSKNEAGEMIQMRAVQINDTSPLPKAFWVAQSTLSVIFTVYALVHFAIYLDGYYATCNQYRKMVEKLLGVHGTALPVLHGRLSCQSIFDFMDYMQPDSFNAFRDGTINTGADLTIGIVASFFAWCLFASTAFVNIKLARTPPT